MIELPIGDPILSVAQIVPITEAEGPGIRFALWFQGCPLRCPGCCNPEFLKFSGGTPMHLSEVLAQVDAARESGSVEGITLLGGEPTSHAIGAAALAKACQERGLSVMTFTGFTLEEHQAKADPAVLELISLTDILVDGPYLRDQPDDSRRWIGSTNQRIHFLTPRYRAEDACWQQRNTLEIRLDPEGITINGFPAQSAVGLWKGWRRPARKTTPPSAESQDG
ncbi:4Fe-4S single cluster domain-containing protein [Tuwongella immobilis]|uniref:Radical SAM core domain-containing protein n=1 Tax=Tuwongella immobilis TaxID=692036 RepID=A0A6C2YM42_9BACT|nr:4Fe-4S single cluster domain-containing protein [Tuwongella immobilis]VIP01992.1 radical sam protein : Anaerobic ribonucleoside-triphosphate reductase-activating protein OS=Isosphaera pallida (strain ATCC 43644 / DSM 9630 / IS1B) GN=Isop_1721 PE=3 SV=1: Fer4_12: Radical_SAM [Tuwongella immobilis]VTS00063.1 radical sam protein : Anaerobic ribonucleoside-triphosphate reductase-activating protein OS=Isosphaera pallida (strain ATCC 43644 / DSM 9630 / IS1B) GN=Isop_1721 PE=3 SV=1: Fer4_12: Radical_